MRRRLSLLLLALPTHALAESPSTCPTQPLAPVSATVGAGCPVYLYRAVDDCAPLYDEADPLLVKVSAGSQQEVSPVLSTIEMNMTRTRCNIESCTEQPETLTGSSTRLLRVDVPGTVPGDTIDLTYDGGYETWDVTVTADACATAPTLITVEGSGDRCDFYPACRDDGDDEGSGCSVSSDLGMSLLAMPLLAGIIGLGRRRRRIGRPISRSISR